MRRALLTLLVSLGISQQLAAAADKPCRIEVVEKDTGWPIPMVELRTTNHVRLVSDNAGLIACDLPDLMGVETWFTVIGHGYEAKADGFGYRGVRLTPEPGKTLRVELTRKNIAKRLGRLTGAGLLAESQKLGEALDWKDQGVFGCDSVQNAVHQGKLYWFYGDTTMARYPLGIFHGTGGTTAVKPEIAAKPPVRLSLEYFRDKDGKPAPSAVMPGEGPTWITGLISLPDATSTPRLVCSYNKIKPPLDAYQWGLATWNETSKAFDPHRIVWTKSDATPKAPLVPDGHPVLWKDDTGKEWVLYGNPFPAIRHPATFEAWQDSSTWEKVQPQAELRSTAGAKVIPHTGSIAWNAWRKRWVTVFMEKFGKPSAFGELWYAEADAPTGPWGPAVKILTHENYTFYNPRLHPEFSGPESPALYFEGTYTSEFADKPQQTPRYDYNQILYRLDLDDPALVETHRK